MKEKFYIEAKVKKVDKDIKNAIKKAGIKYPHHSLAFFKATYAKIGKANSNGIMLAESVKDDVPFLIGTQMNMNHYRRGYIMGEIIDAYVTKEDEIEIIFTFHKTIYEKEYKEAIELMTKDKLTVSFELMVEKNDIELLPNRVRKLLKVSFDGVGLLFAKKPAYRNAFVLETAMKQIEDLLQSEDKQLIYASVKDIAHDWAKIGQLLEKTITERGEEKMDEKTNEALLAKQKEIVISEFGEDAVKDWSDEDFLNDEKIQALRESLKQEESSDDDKDSEAKEDNSEEKTEEKDEASESEEEENSEEQKEVDKEEKEEASEDENKEEKAEKTTQEVEEKRKTTSTYDDETKIETVTTEGERIVKRDGKEVYRTKIKEDQVYTYAEVEAIKSEYEEQIKFLKANAQKIVKIREEMGKFVDELSDEELFNEEKMEVARLKKENFELKKAQGLETAEDKEEVKEEKEEDNKDESSEDKEPKKEEDKEEKKEEKEEVKEEKEEEKTEDSDKDKEEVKEEKEEIEEEKEEEKKEDEDLSTGHEDITEEEDSPEASKARMKEFVTIRHKKVQ